MAPARGWVDHTPRPQHRIPHHDFGGHTAFLPVQALTNPAYTAGNCLGDVIPTFIMLHDFAYRWQHGCSREAFLLA
jgi:hypothetical protein